VTGALAPRLERISRCLHNMPSAYVNERPAVPTNLFSASDLAAQRSFFARRPSLAPTPLHRCSGLAEGLGVGELLVKDETARFGLNAFKSTGALFTVATLVERGEIRRGDTLVCASEGNHGRAVARAAREMGCSSRVYMSQRVARARVEAIASEGADVILIDGSYDDAVRVMAEEAKRNRWTIVSDTSWEGYAEIPRLIMLGYTRIMDEVDATLAGTRPQVIFVPAGVGGLLAAVACWCDLRFGAARPRVVAVEPLEAACVQASVRAGQPTTVPGPFDTTMGGLRCGEMSASVYPVSASLVDAFVGIEDEFAFDAMRRLGRASPPDAVIECGPSGAAALGGLIAVLTSPECATVRQAVGIGSSSSVLVIVTEGVTDPAVFASALA
jgi:diaminopropionate ammonia-lyase